jgi:hypothetical protein
MIRHRCFANFLVAAWLLAVATVCTTGILPGRAHAATPVPGSAPLSPSPVEGLAYTNAFFPASNPDPGIPTPKSLLGFDIGDRAVSSGEIENVLRAWSVLTTNRTRLIEYARSHEGRPLQAFVITAPHHHARLDAIQAGFARLADPRGLSDAEATRLADSLPAIAWLGYCIHGDETEGSDAALAVAHHLLADRTPETAKLLEDLIVIIDPVQNPDGRDRFLKMVAEHRGTSPNLDQQSLLHAGYWPRGRVNHYLFDLNRDWIFATQPETRGRLLEVARWNPLLFVDVHGMSGEDTYLFSPPREPMNRHLPANRTTWGRVFARDQARAFDANGWLYYTGEWNENWYPGYSDSWSVFRGAVGVLYEVASIAEDGVRHADGRIQSFRESVHQHIVSSMANLRTLQVHARTRVREFAAERRANVATEGPFARRTWAVPPTANRSRLAGFIDTLRVQGVEMHQLTAPFTAPIAGDQFGRSLTNRVLPSGTLLIANRQPVAPLVAALLDFDPRMTDASLEDERRELLRTGGSRIYDVTSWNLTLFHGLEAFVLLQDLPAEAQALGELSPPRVSPAVESPVAWVIDGADDGSVALAAQLMERGVRVRVADKDFVLDSHAFARGSVVVTALDNRRFAGDVAATLMSAAKALHLTVIPVSTGLGEDDLPDLGGQHFRRLEPPRIAVVGRGEVQPNDFGTIWHLLDQHLGIRHSHLNDDAGTPEFPRYNVIVLPDRGDALPAAWREPLVDWVKAGGTLIAIQGAAADLVSRTNELTRVRPLPEVLGKLADYEQTIFREWLAQTGPMPASSNVWTTTLPKTAPFPWPVAADSPKEEELKKRDAWNALFMPQGAVLAARVDPKHWLTFGAGPVLPVLAGQQAVLMSGSDVEAPVRFGVFTPAANAPEPLKPADPAEKHSPIKASEPARIGWCSLPEGYELHLRLSGLFWPEAGQRLAHSAAITRESLGRGQVILFAGSPTFRAATRGTARLLANAMVYGPGLGTAATVKP